MKHVCQPLPQSPANCYAACAFVMDWHVQATGAQRKVELFHIEQH